MKKTGLTNHPFKVIGDYGEFQFTERADYTVSYSNNINAGTATVTITGIGFYEGTTGTTFRITSRSIGEVTVEKLVKVLCFSGEGVQHFVQKIE